MPNPSVDEMLRWPDSRDADSLLLASRQETGPTCHETPECREVLDCERHVHPAL